MTATDEKQQTGQILKNTCRADQDATEHDDFQRLLSDLLMEQAEQQ